MGVKTLLGLAGVVLSLAILAFGDRLAALFVRPQPAISEDYARFLQENSVPLFDVESTGGRAYLVQNPVFWKRDSGQRLPLEKEAGVRRILVVGESSADWLGAAMRQELEANGLGRRYEILNCAISAGDLEIVARREKECLAYSPDAVVVLFGHNLFYRHPHVPRWLLRPLLLSRRSALVAAAADLFQRSPERDTEAARLRALQGFLDATAQAARKRGLPLILSTAPSNLWVEPESSEAERRAPRYLQAVYDLESGRSRKAIADLDECRGAGALCHFTLGRMLFEGSRWAEAARQLTAARDLDPRRMRATTAINSMIRDAAVRDGALLVDSDESIRKWSPHGIPGWESFVDAQHVDPRRFHRLAKETLEVLAARGWTELSALPSALPKDDELSRGWIADAFQVVPVPNPEGWRTFALFAGAHLPFFARKGDAALAEAFPDARMHAAACLGLAEAFWQAGDRRLAWTKNEQAGRLSPDWDQPFLQAALFRMRGHDRSGAAAFLEKTLKANPDNAQARFLLEQERAGHRVP